MFARQGEFANEEHLNALLRQEARAGWTLAEKYSDTYVRLRRPAYARDYDWRLPRSIDPYRTTYTLSVENQVIHLIFYTACVIVVLITMVLLVVFASWPR
jgi:hypothetical protein